MSEGLTYSQGLILQNALANGALGVHIVPEEKLMALISDPLSWRKKENMGLWLAGTTIGDPRHPDERWTAVDNSEGYCYTEDFKNLDVAFDYLLGRTKETTDELHERDGTFDQTSEAKGKDGKNGIGDQEGVAGEGQCGDHRVGD